MAYVLPNFNLQVSIWFAGNTPGTGGPDLTDQPAQKYVDSRSAAIQLPTSPNVYFPPVYWRFPISVYAALTLPFVTGIIYYSDSLGNAWYYSVRWWEIEHDGFGNQYLSCLTVQSDTSGTAPDAGR